MENKKLTIVIHGRKKIKDKKFTKPAVQKKRLEKAGLRQVL